MYEVGFHDGTVVTMEACYRAEARYYALRGLWRRPYQIREVAYARLVRGLNDGTI